VRLTVHLPGEDPIVVTDKRLLALLAILALGGIAAGCGSTEGDDNLTMAEAKSRLVEDCQDDDDTAQEKEICVCIADELEAQKLTPKRVDSLRKVANTSDADSLDDVPKEFNVAIQACAKKLAAKAAG